jgi:hypothetical protein
MLLPWDLSGLQAKLNEIAESIEVCSEINFTMQTTQNAPGTVIRMTFGVTGSIPADAS